MQLKAAQDFKIDLPQSWMVGDGENGMDAGQNADCQTAITGMSPWGQTMTALSLKDFGDPHPKQEEE